MISKLYYHSKNGNTAQVAEAMARGAATTAVEIDGNPADVHVDLLFIGDGNYGGKVDPATEKFIAGLDPKKIGHAVAFGTYAFNKKNVLKLQELLKARGIAVEESSFACKGKYALFNGKHPTDKDLSDAVLFVDHMVRKYKAQK